MGGKSSSTPKGPDYEKLAQMTAQSNMDAAKYATQANRPNQITPWGSITWTNDRSFNQGAYDQALAAYNSQVNNGGSWVERPYDGYGYQGDGQSYVREWVPNSGSSSKNLKAPDPNDYYTGGDNWTQTMQFSPEVQGIYDRALRNFGSDFDLSSLPEAGKAYDPNLATNNATELIMQRLNPQLDRQYESLRNQLANQGIAQGSEAYNRALSTFGQQRNDAASQAALYGINLGMQQQGMSFDQANQLRNQGLQEQSYLRSLPANELSMLLGGASSSQFPGYSQQATTGGTDYLGAGQSQYQSQLAAQNAANAGSSNMMSGLFGLGQLGIMGYGAGLFSDRRLKRNIRRVGSTNDGLGIYAYQYIWGGPEQIGLMAQEVEKVNPAAVSQIGGLKIIDYAKV